MKMLQAVILFGALAVAHSSASGLLDVSSTAGRVLRITSASEPHHSDVLVKRVNDTLLLTCADDDADVTWYLPNDETPYRNEDAEWRTVGHSGTAAVWGGRLRVTALQLRDTGRYTCEVPPFTVSKYVVVQRPAPVSCSLGGFSCGVVCVLPLFVCDGRADCPHGEDESRLACGTDRVCEGKLACRGGRCLSPAWCQADSPTRHACCELHDPEPPFLPDPLRPPPDYGLIQSTILTVTACALIFMVAAVLLVTAICKMHMKRAALRSLGPRYCVPPCYSYEPVSLRGGQSPLDAPPPGPTAAPEPAPPAWWPRCGLSDPPELLHTLTLHAAHYPHRAVPPRYASDSVTLRLGRLRVSVPRLRGRGGGGSGGAGGGRRPDTPDVDGAELEMLRDATDTYTLNGRTIRLLGAEIQCAGALDDGADPARLVGRVVSPPPYSARAAAAPAKTYGPPPAYLSREDLTDAPVSPRPAAALDCNGNTEAPVGTLEPPPQYEDLTQPPPVDLDDNHNPV